MRVEFALHVNSAVSSWHVRVLVQGLVANHVRHFTALIPVRWLLGWDASGWPRTVLPGCVVHLIVFCLYIATNSVFQLFHLHLHVVLSLSLISIRRIMIHTIGRPSLRLWRWRVIRAFGTSRICRHWVDRELRYVILSLFIRERNFIGWGRLCLSCILFRSHLEVFLKTLAHGFFLILLVFFLFPIVPSQVWVLLAQVVKFAHPTDGLVSRRLFSSLPVWGILSIFPTTSILHIVDRWHCEWVLGRVHHLWLLRGFDLFHWGLHWQLVWHFCWWVW